MLFKLFLFFFCVLSFPQTLKICTSLCSITQFDLITGFQNKLYASILFLNVDLYIFLFGHPCRFAMHQRGPLMLGICFFEFLWLEIRHYLC